MQTLADFVKTKRKEARLTQMEFAHRAGVALTVVRKLEQGKQNLNFGAVMITEATDKYRSSMERIGKALNKYAANTLLDQLRFFEIAVFSFLTGNNDMHLKNFSMIMNPNGEWGLAPAYDLLNVSIALPEDKEELALTLNGKKAS